jgi:hypothetical protein
MSEKDLIVDIVNRYGVDVTTAMKIIETKNVQSRIQILIVFDDTDLLIDCQNIKMPCDSHSIR